MSVFSFFTWKILRSENAFRMLSGQRDALAWRGHLFMAEEQPEPKEPRGLALKLYHPDLVGKPCRRVKKADTQRARALVEKMTRLCVETGANGLAAPQVGVYARLAVVVGAGGKQVVLVNPEIVMMAGRDLLESESCLSLPGATAKVWRSEIVQVRAGTIEEPEKLRVTAYKGKLARAIQHEIDHLNGIFFIDRCQAVSREIALRGFVRYSSQLPVVSSQPQSQGSATENCLL
jgi:peptide deformylase